MKNLNLKLNQNGSSLIAAIFIVTIMSMVGMGMVQMAAGEAYSTSNDLNITKSQAVSIASLEYAKRSLDNGLDPTVTGKELGNGTFDITTDPANRQVVTTSHVGDAVSTQTISTNFAADCIALNTQNVTRSNSTLAGLSIDKSCNTTATLTSMVVTFNSHVCALQTNLGMNAEAQWNYCNNLNYNSNNSSNYVTHLAIGNTHIYKPMSGIGAPALGLAKNGVEINTVDYSATTNTSYLYQWVNGQSQVGGFELNSFIIMNTLWKVTLKYSDGSSEDTFFRSI